MFLVLLYSILVAKCTPDLRNSTIFHMNIGENISTLVLWQCRVAESDKRASTVYSDICCHVYQLLL